jgi:hypothetical protein
MENDVQTLRSSISSKFCGFTQGQKEGLTEAGFTLMGKKNKGS